jgi:hypothetical protein
VARHLGRVVSSATTWATPGSDPREGVRPMWVSCSQLPGRPATADSSARRVAARCARQFGRGRTRVGRPIDRCHGAWRDLTGCPCRGGARRGPAALPIEAGVSDAMSGRGAPAWPCSCAATSITEHGSRRTAVDAGNVKPTVPAGHGAVVASAGPQWLGPAAIPSSSRVLRTTSAALPAGGIGVVGEESMGEPARFAGRGSDTALSKARGGGRLLAGARAARGRLRVAQAPFSPRGAA